MNRRFFQFLTRWTLAAALTLLPAGGSVAEEGPDVSKLPAPAPGPVDFAQIQPIFKAKCYDCHGPEHEEGGLRLDVKARALDGGDSGPALVPGQSAKSRLVHLIAGLDGERMPPEDEAEPLTAEEVALVRAWIDAGAAWPDEADNKAALSRWADHWAFQPILAPAEPAVKQADWVRNGIDAFILRKLESEGVRPSPEADRAALARRLYLDLHGLPPAPAELAEFLNDTSSDAYERLVDRLLASPHYGERWARHWLDLARYADSDGYEKDNQRPHAWRWRQWVIEAINDDMPFDRFTIEQLAGDLLPGATLEQKVAVGFHRNTLVNTEGGTDKEEDRVKRTVDRTNTLGSVWLGLTVECAQCHTHKYDPITQREYFGLYAFFNSMSEPDIPAPLPRQLKDYRLAKAAFDKDHAPFVKAIEDYEAKGLAANFTQWEASFQKGLPEWTVLEPSSVSASEGTTLKVQKDGSVLASGADPAGEVYTVVAATSLPGVTAIRLEVLPDKSLPKQGPGRSSGGNFVLTDVRLSVSQGQGVRPVGLQNAQADFSQTDWPVAAAIDDDATSGWAVSPQVGQAHVAIFETAEDLGTAGGQSELAIELKQNYEKGPHNIGRFRLSVTSAARPVRLHSLPDKVEKILALPRDSRTDAQRAELLTYYRTIDPQHVKLKQAADEHAKKAPADPGEKVKAQSIDELAKPRVTSVHLRGNFLEPGPVVERQTLAILPPLKARGDQPDRLDLAHWVVDPANPLTARVTVNRVWQRLFGRGLVASSDNFGTQGERPSHPELLDWLAASLQEHGWSMKALHKLIVTSATYRQSSVARPELLQRDPYNTWLARQNRLRVEAEVIRDLALAAGGLLHREVGGPSVRPLQAEGIASLGYANSVKWPVSQGKDRYRRGLYTFFQRAVPYPMLVTFDAPDSTLTCTRRERSNTPLQSLTLWNDPVFFECAQALGRRIVTQSPPGGDAAAVVEQRVRYAFLLSLGREPEADEAAIVRQLYRDQLALCEADVKAAEAIAGSLPRPDGMKLPELASWVIVGRTLMNLDEFINRQ